MLKLLTFFTTFLLSQTIMPQTYDWNECHIKGKPQFTTLPCTEACISNICIMKAECNIGAGPVVVELTCAAITENQCPTLITCANDKSVSYKRTLNINNLYNSPSGYSGAASNGK